ncbi:USP6 N-terminal-like protein [Camelus dromedarius]|uniref:USP6 N-terminal-like protein n=1 Tax=Camelus dromedarius TaxID=9838 RepID=A0A5N4BY07_CAMDR|nr:USP6 N-terminal-like protein [Camelus dromedarius]
MEKLETILVSEWAEITAKYAQEVRYCQGRNQVVAVLFMFLSEEDAFWALAQLMTDQKHTPCMVGSPKLLRFQAHHEHILGRALPKLKRHMDKEQMSTGIHTTKWFLQCFTDRTLPLKLWDTYILDSEHVLMAMTHTVLTVHKKCFLKLPLEGLWEFLQDTLSQSWALEDNVVLRQLQASMAELRRMKCDLPPQAKRALSELHLAPWGLDVPRKATSVT